MPITAERIPGALIDSAVDDGIVGISMISDKCYGLNATASHVWNALEQPRTVDELADSLCANFAVDRATALKSAEAVVRQLADEGLLKLHIHSADGSS